MRFLRPTNGTPHPKKQRNTDAPDERQLVREDDRPNPHPHCTTCAGVDDATGSTHCRILRTVQEVSHLPSAFRDTQRGHGGIPTTVFELQHRRMHILQRHTHSPAWTGCPIRHRREGRAGRIPQEDVGRHQENVPHRSEFGGSLCGAGITHSTGGGIAGNGGARICQMSVHSRHLPRIISKSRRWHSRNRNCCMR